MGIENATYIKDLIPTWPEGTDPKSQGDDHLRLIKAVLQDQFHGFTTDVAITVTADHLNDSYTETEATAALALKAPLADPAFTGVPTAPTAAPGTDTTQIATTAFAKAQADSGAIGVGQTWQDVTGSRAANTTYTNSTGKPIMLMISASLTNGGVVQITVGGALLTPGTAGSGNNGLASAIVQAGATYSCTFGAASLSKWSELR